MAIKHTVHRVKLKNGSEGLLIDTPGQSVMDVSFGFPRSGFDYTERDKYQLPHLLEHLVALNVNDFYPTTKDFNKDFCKNGAYKNAFTNSNRVKYVAQSALFEWDRVLDLMGKMLSKKTFNDNQIESEKSIIRGELTDYTNNHQRTLYSSMKYALGLCKTPFKEIITSIDNIQKKDIEEYYYKTHIAENMRFIVVCDMSENRQQVIIDKIEKWNLPSGDNKPTLNLVRAKKTKNVHINKKIDNINYHIMIAVNRELSPIEDWTIGLINNLLVRMLFSSWIFGEARERGLCYNISAGRVVSGRGYSIWNFWGEANKEKIPHLFNLIKDKIRLLIDNGVSEEELRQVKDYTKGSNQLRVQTNGNLRDWYNDKFIDLNYIDEINYEAIIESITSDDIVKLAKEFVDSGIWCLGTVGDITKQEADDLAKPLKELLGE